MILWIDADACPQQIRDIVLRAINRLHVQTIFVANKPLYLPPMNNLSFIQVKPGPDVADAYILEHATAGDFVITQDIPLAAELVPKNISVLSPRGDLYTADNIADNLARRNLLQDLRDQGEVLGGPRPFDEKIKRQFANHFDAELNKLMRKTNES
ncbi:MAG: YaiI/YqxD family protein [Candidatus Obscuribacterales bacterium]|nr:YaiI/YqxD family protein [Candidatus Obscuribacterales bacterium]